MRFLWLKAMKLPATREDFYLCSGWLLGGAENNSTR